MGMISKTFGNICYNCDNLKENNTLDCVDCFSENLRHMEYGHCVKCLDPRPFDYMHFPQCYTCKTKIENNEYHLDGIISCSYHFNKEGCFGFALHTYKGSEMKRRKWMAFPLQALVFEFLKRHMKCIINKYGDIDAIIPIEGFAEKLLTESSYNDIPVKKILRDSKPYGRQSSGGKRLFNPERFNIPQKVPSNILLFDDVLTRGVTTNSAAFALKKAGAEKVILFALGKNLGYTQKYLADETKKFSINTCLICDNQPF